MDFKTLKNEKEIKMYLNAALSNKSWTSAYHYTSLESLYQIFKSKTLRLSNIKGMNDILESNFANDIDECFFCMSRGSGGKIENFGMWAMYGHIPDYLLEKLIVFPSPLANISHCQDEYNKLVQGNAAIVPTFRENSYKQLFQTNNERREKL